MDFSLLKTTFLSTLDEFYNKSPTFLFATIFAVVFGVVSCLGEFFRSSLGEFFSKNKEFEPTLFEDYQCKDYNAYRLHQSTFFKKSQLKDKKKKLSVFKKQAIERIKEDFVQNKINNLVKMTPTISPSYCSLFRRRKRFRDSMDGNKENISKCSTPQKKVGESANEFPSTYALRSRRINF